MKKTFLTIASLSLLLPHHSFAMQEHNKTSQKKLKLSFGSNSIYSNLSSPEVQASTANQENRFTNLQPTEVSTLASHINGYNNKQIKIRNEQAKIRDEEDPISLCEIIKQKPCLAVGYTTGVFCVLACYVAVATGLFLSIVRGNTH